MCIPTEIPVPQFFTDCIFTSDTSSLLEIFTDGAFNFRLFTDTKQIYNQNNKL